MAKVTFIGLGVMGGPMAGWLAKAGHVVTVYNRSPARATAWVEHYGGRSAPTPAEAARGADFVMACVGDDPDLEAVTLGHDGALETMKPNAVFVDHTTASADIARLLHQEALNRGLHFIDAPISGGEAGAVNGQLTVMCGGHQEPYARAEAIIQAYAKACRLIGGPGAGQLCKMVNQICIAGLVQGLSEGLAFAQCAGLDSAAVVEAISQGAAGSWQMSNRYKTMLEDSFDFGFAVDWMRKDLRICLAEANGNGASLPVTALVDQHYAEIQRMGGGRWDTSSLIKRLPTKKS